MRARFAVLLCAFAAFGGHAFAQQCPTGVAPVAQSPSGTNQNENTPITFSWSPSATSGVTGYDVFATTGNSRTRRSSAPSRRERELVQRSAPPVSRRACTPGPSAPNFANCNLVSATKQFTVNCLTSAPSIQSPSDGSQNVFSNTDADLESRSAAPISTTSTSACRDREPAPARRNSRRRIRASIRRRSRPAPATNGASSRRKRTPTRVRSRPAAARSSRPPPRRAIRPARSISPRRPTRARPARRRR